MRQHPFLHKQVIPAQQYLRHHITFITKMFEAVLRPKVIKTISSGKTLRTTAVHRVAIPVYRLITTLEKLKANVPTSLHHIPLRFRYEVVEQTHDTRFPTAHGSSHQQPITQVNVNPPSVPLTLNKPFCSAIVLKI